MTLRIKEIKKLDNKLLTVDISTEDHTYQFSNGIVSHNTASKIMDTTEGIHKPLSKYLLNNIILSKVSPLHALLKEANYRIQDHPFDSTSAIISFPIMYEDVEFDIVQKEIDGKIHELEVNTESAIEQLNRYKFWMNNYVDHNASITISFIPEEIPDICDWFDKNWDHFVGVSFLLRADPTKTAKELGHIYLPQQPITKEEYFSYIEELKDIDIENLSISSIEKEQTGDINMDLECATGVCPVR
jgi:hypothetical protein